MASDRMQKPVLVLNASYEPINICATRRALVLVLKGVARAEEESVNSVRSSRAAVRLPSVIRLLEYRRIPHQTRALSRKNILMRDRYTCQYCHRVMPSAELTLDHVIPRSRAGESAWENLVACCHLCNNRKGNRTPEEAGMKLARQPQPFSLHTSRHLMRMLGNGEGAVAQVPVLLRTTHGVTERSRAELCARLCVPRACFQPSVGHIVIGVFLVLEGK